MNHVMHRRRFPFSASPMSEHGASSKNGKVEQWITKVKRVEEIKENTEEQVLAGKIFVITGSLKRFENRDKLKEKIEEHLDEEDEDSDDDE